MRGITTTFAAAILALGTAVAVAAPALATEGEFLNDLRNDGFTGSDSVLLDWGYRIWDDWQTSAFASSTPEGSASDPFLLLSMARATFAKPIRTPAVSNKAEAVS